MDICDMIDHELLKPPPHFFSSPSDFDRSFGEIEVNGSDVEEVARPAPSRVDILPNDGDDDCYGGLLEVSSLEILPHRRRHQDGRTPAAD